MATYKEIQGFTKQVHSVDVATCHIADVLRGYGLTTRIAANRIDPAKPVKPCPSSKRAAIEGALKHFGMI